MPVRRGKKSENPLGRKGEGEARSSPRLVRAAYELTLERVPSLSKLNNVWILDYRLSGTVASASPDLSLGYSTPVVHPSGMAFGRRTWSWVRPADPDEARDCVLDRDQPPDCVQAPLEAPDGVQAPLEGPDCVPAPLEAPSFVAGPGGGGSHDISVPTGTLRRRRSWVRSSRPWLRRRKPWGLTFHVKRRVTQSLSAPCRRPRE